MSSEFPVRGRKKTFYPKHHTHTQSERSSDGPSETAGFAWDSLLKTQNYRLASYIRNALALGYSKNIIRKRLLKDGWKTRQVDKYLPAGFDVKIVNYALLILVLAVLTSAAVFFRPEILGAFTGLAGEENWENGTEILANSSLEFITAHIVFGEHKPANCSEGIMIEAVGQAIDFATADEIYLDGLCQETDIIFRNLIYETLNETEIAPEENKTLPENITIPEESILPPETPSSNQTYQNETSPEINPAPEAPQESRKGILSITGAAVGISNIENQITYRVYYGKIPEEDKPAPVEPANITNPVFNGDFETFRGDSLTPAGWFIKGSIDLAEEDNLDWQKLYQNKNPLNKGKGFSGGHALLLPREFFDKEVYIISKPFPNSPSGFYNFSFYYLPEKDCPSLTLAIIYFSKGQNTFYTDEISIQDSGDFHSNDLFPLQVSINKISDWYKVEFSPLESRKSWGDKIAIELRGGGFVDDIRYGPA